MGWVDADRFLEEASSTWATAPLTAREAVLARQVRDPRYNEPGGTLSDRPEAFAQRALRRRRRLGT